MDLFSIQIQMPSMVREYQKSVLLNEVKIVLKEALD